LWRTKPVVEHQRERLWLEDGDFLDLDWHGTPSAHEPLVLVLHGLTGSSASHYIGPTMRAGKTGLGQRGVELARVLGGAQPAGTQLPLRGQ
jgi:predicted alpha/beta-fold hydrolase